MLSGLRTAQKGWLGKIIVAVMFGFLILSFGIWGIGDIFRIAHRETVATVGSREITAIDYRYTFQNELQRLSYQARRNVTMAEALAAGIDRQVLATMIADAALDQKARELGLALADKTITQAVYADPAFRGADGRFDPNLFLERLRQSGYTEQSFLAEQRGLYLRRQIAEGFAGAPAVPALMLEALHRFTAETRSVDTFTLGPNAVGEIAQPDAAALQAFYDGRKSEFAAPEYRALVLLALDPAAMAKPDTVPEADVRAEYEKQKDSRFTTPEKRTVERIPFKDKDAAQAVAAKLKQGASFDDIAKEMGLSAQDLSIGVAMTRDAIADPALAQAAFSLPQGTPSEVVDTKFGPVIARVIAIDPVKVKSYEEVEPQLRQDIATLRAKTGLRDLRDKIEDQRASAKPIADIAAALGLPAVKIEAIDAAGNGKDGKPVEAIPDKDLVLKAAFQAEVGSDNDAVSLRDGGYVWFDVTGIERARDRPLAEVRDKVVEAWTADQRSLALAKMAADLVKRLEGGTPIADLAKEEKVEVNSVEDITRSSKPPGLSPAALNAIFSVKSDGAGYALGADGLSRLVFKVKSASLPPPDPIAEASLRPRLATALEDDRMQSYVQQLEKELGTSIDDAAARAALRGSGGDAGEQ
jgi:peptidyl-prolyl cis-trans isomerase D